MRFKPTQAQNEKVCRLLRQQRDIVGLTQQQTARRAGVAIAHYQKFEGGQRVFLTARFKTVMAVLAALEIDANAFIATHLDDEGAAA
jgi:transcriptional regulator with XRE-family HTH domain